MKNLLNTHNTTYDITHEYSQNTLDSSNSIVIKAKEITNIDNLLKIYGASEHLRCILDDSDNNVTTEISKLLQKSYELLNSNANTNTNISYETFIVYLLNLIDNHKNIKYTSENILQYVTLVDYFILDIQDDFFNYILDKYIFTYNMFYDKLYQYNIINYYILDKFSKKNNIKNETFEYIFDINKNMCNEITTLYSQNIKQNVLNKCTYIIKLNINNNMHINSVNHLQMLVELDVSRKYDCGKIEEHLFRIKFQNAIKQDGISQLLFIKKLNACNNSHITDVNHMQCLTELNISNDCSVKQIGISHLQFVKKLNVYNNHKINDVNHLQCLTNLNISGESCGVKQNGILQLLLVKKLNISNNVKITNINHLKFLKNVNMFDSDYYDGYDSDNDENNLIILVKNQIFISLLNITTLNVQECELITNVNHLQLLVNLNISGNLCGVNQEGISQLLFVKKLNASYNQKITDVNHLQFLEDLNISDHRDGVNQNGIAKITTIKKLDIGCSKQITNINHLQLLEDLNMSSHCDVTQNGFSKIVSIKKLNISANSKITCVNHLKQLESLNISHNLCGVQQEGILNTLSIKKLNVSNNSKITNINHLQWLVDLDISGDLCCVDQEGIQNLLFVKKLNTKYNYKIININHLLPSLKKFYTPNGKCIENNAILFMANI